MDRKIHWHSAFCAAMELEFRDNKDDLEYEREYPFSFEPLKADLLIIKKRSAQQIVNEVGRMFRAWNIIEYKSPEDSMNIDDFYKVCAYACLFKAQAASVDSRPAEEITVSLIRRRYPRKLIGALKRAGFAVRQRYKGVYAVEGAVLFATQIVVSDQLEAESHAWLRALKAGILETEFKEFAARFLLLEDKHDRECGDAILEVVSGANVEIVRKWREDPIMCETLAEIMEPEITMAREQGLERGLEQGLEQGLERGREQGREQGIKLTKMVIRLEAQGCKVGEIAKQAGISEEEVLAILA